MGGHGLPTPTPDLAPTFQRPLAIVDKFTTVPLSCRRRAGDIAEFNC